MGEVSTIGVDLAKNVFQVHGAAADGSVLFRKKLSRPQFARFMAQQPPCLVAMEACASAHHWAREMARYGHEVRLIAPHYVKPFLKRQKNDAADAEAIVEAALRPTMRFVEPKSADQQARAVAFRTREQFVKRRTEAVNALRSHLYEFGHVAPEGIGYVPRLERVVKDPDADIPDLARDICRMLLEQITHLTDRIKELKARIAAMSNEAEMPRQLQTMPGVGPITALAVETFAPPMDQFRRGRDFAAWLGLVPRQHSTGGKQKLGKTSKMGQRDIRRLLVIGATAVIRWASRRGAPKGSWLARMLERKPIPVVAPVSRTNRPDKRPHSITSPEDQKFLANRAAPTKEGSTSGPSPPPLALAKAFSRSGCGRIFSLFSRVMREGLLTGLSARRSGSVLSGPIFSGPVNRAQSGSERHAIEIMRFNSGAHCGGVRSSVRQAAGTRIERSANGPMPPAQSHHSRPAATHGRRRLPQVLSFHRA